MLFLVSEFVSWLFLGCNLLLSCCIALGTFPRQYVFIFPLSVLTFFLLHFLWDSNSLSLYMCSVLCLAMISDEMINYHFTEWKWDSYSHCDWRPNNSVEAKYIWIPKHFNHKYIDFTDCMASLFCGSNGVAQDKPGRWACVTPMQGSGGPWPLLGSLGVSGCCRGGLEPCWRAMGSPCSLSGAPLSGFSLESLTQYFLESHGKLFSTVTGLGSE